MDLRPLPGLPFDGKRVIGSKEALQLPEQPKSIVIIGAGAIGGEPKRAGMAEVGVTGGRRREASAIGRGCAGGGVRRAES